MFWEKQWLLLRAVWAVTIASELLKYAVLTIEVPVRYD
jgi:hypothetical protein